MPKQSCCPWCNRRCACLPAVPPHSRRAGRDCHCRKVSAEHAKAMVTVRCRLKVARLGQLGAVHHVRTVQACLQADVYACWCLAFGWQAHAYTALPACCACAPLIVLYSSTLLKEAGTDCPLQRQPKPADESACHVTPLYNALTLKAQLLPFSQLHSRPYVSAHCSCTQQYNTIAIAIHK